MVGNEGRDNHLGERRGTSVEEEGSPYDNEALRRSTCQIQRARPALSTGTLDDAHGPEHAVREVEGGVDGNYGRDLAGLNVLVEALHCQVILGEQGSPKLGFHRVLEGGRGRSCEGSVVALDEVAEEGWGVVDRLELSLWALLWAGRDGAGPRVASRSSKLLGWRLSGDPERLEPGPEEHAFGGRGEIWILRKNR